MMLMVACVSKLEVQVGPVSVYVLIACMWYCSSSVRNRCCSACACIGIDAEYGYGAFGGGSKKCVEPVYDFFADLKSLAVWVVCCKVNNND